MNNILGVIYLHILLMGQEEEGVPNQHTVTSTAAPYTKKEGKYRQELYSDLEIELNSKIEGIELNESESDIILVLLVLL